ncbi:hypothetical protein METHB2_660009 [Candidatus Methylobacter favarea]|uniref:Uncharacterized protein n=2 Tax=Candidatus Methylobacter favarea TaxID=2707345 RepID=A0A8S0XUF7_9GAMM|nr:hypothetical protein METHB2_660009 [Candidatus Methylobacter favarea]
MALPDQVLIAVCKQWIKPQTQEGEHEYAPSCDTWIPSAPADNGRVDFSRELPEHRR